MNGNIGPLTEKNFGQLDADHIGLIERRGWKNVEDGGRLIVPTTISYPEPGITNRRKHSMDLSNYSAKDLIQEWILDRARAPLLLKKAVELEGIEGVLALAKEYGVAPSTMRMYLMRAGCIATLPKTKPEDPFRDKLEKLWRRDRARFMDIVEGLWSTNGL